MGRRTTGKRVYLTCMGGICVNVEYKNIKVLIGVNIKYLTMVCMWSW